MEPAITLRILSHNREKFLGETLASAFAQTLPFAEFELYDNGSDFSLRRLAKKHPRLRLRRCARPVPAWENLLRAFADPPATRWLCVFHDDDLFEPDFGLHLQNAIRKYPRAGAISCNGTVIDARGKKRGRLLPKLDKELICARPADLGRWYCDGFVPFPPTVYRWNQKFGRYLAGAAGYGRCADVGFLAKIVQHAPIVVLPQFYFRYRRHQTQDSAGFQWWEETKRWQLQLDLCRGDSKAIRYVQHKRNERLTSRWLQAWLKDEPRPEPLERRHFSAGSAYRFFRNNKLRILRRCLFRQGQR